MKLIKPYLLAIAAMTLPFTASSAQGQPAQQQQQAQAKAAYEEFKGLHFAYEMEKKCPAIGGLARSAALWGSFDARRALIQMKATTMEKAKEFEAQIAKRIADSDCKAIKADQYAQTVQKFAMFKRDFYLMTWEEYFAMADMAIQDGSPRSDYKCERIAYERITDIRPYTVAAKVRLQEDTANYPNVSKAATAGAQKLHSLCKIGTAGLGAVPMTQMFVSAIGLADAEKK